MTKENNRFVFFKYVPEKKSSRPVKRGEPQAPLKEDIPQIDELLLEPVENTAEPVNEAINEPSVAAGTELEAGKEEKGEIAEIITEEVESSEEVVSTDEEVKAAGMWPGYPKKPDYPKHPQFPDYPDCPEDPECPKYPDYPECPEEPEYPKKPEYPKHPDYPKKPEPEPEPDPCPENSVMHVVKRGDTYWKLARKYKTSVEAIEAANPSVNPLNLQIGQVICVPLGIPGAKG